MKYGYAHFAIVFTIASLTKHKKKPLKKEEKKEEGKERRNQKPSIKECCRMTPHKVTVGCEEKPPPSRRKPVIWFYYNTINL
jgi:hypothetical protein